MGELWLCGNSALAIVSNLKWQDILDSYWSLVSQGGEQPLGEPTPHSVRFSLGKRNFGRVATKTVALRYAVDPAQFLRDRGKQLHQQTRRKG